VIEAVLGNDVKIALLGRFDGDDILSLIGQLKALRGLKAMRCSASGRSWKLT
jgi:hypothetical protein